MNDDGHLVEALRQIRAIVDGALAGKTSAPGVKLSKPFEVQIVGEAYPIAFLRCGKVNSLRNPRRSTRSMRN